MACRNASNTLNANWNFASIAGLNDLYLKQLFQQETSY